VGQGLLIIEDSRSHSDIAHSVGLLWMSDQPNAVTSAWQHTTLTTDRHTSMPPAEFETTIPASERPQTHAFRPRGHWDRLKTGFNLVKWT